MDAVTYPDEDVQTFFNENLIACKLELGKEKELAKKLGVLFTPGLFWLRRDGTAQHQNVGFFPPKELVAEARLGCGKVLSAENKWEAAKKFFDQVIEEGPLTFAAPAAMFWAGVAAKMASGSVEDLLSHWKRLLQEYRDSSWSMKVAFIEQKR